MRREDTGPTFAPKEQAIVSNPHTLAATPADNPPLGFAAMLTSIVLFTLMDASVKWLGASYPTAQIMFFRCAVALVPVLVIVGLLGGLAQYCMTLSYRHVAVGIVAPCKYLTIVFGGILAYLVWREVPDAQSLLSISLIIMTGLYTLRRELIHGGSARP